MVSYNIQRYHNDPEYRKRIREKEKARFDKWVENNPNYHKEYYQRNKKRMNDYANEYHEQLRRELIMVIQGQVKCSLCPITKISLLQAHHVKFNGKEDRARFKQKNGAPDRIAWARHMIKHYHEEKDKYPLQVLCDSCHNHIRGKPDADQITLTNFMF